MTRDELAAAIAALDDAMAGTAKTAVNSREHYLAWQAAVGPLMDADVPVELTEWWQAELHGAMQRAFNHPLLLQRWKAGEYDAGPQRHESLGKAGGPAAAYRGYVIGIELRRATVDAPWGGYATLAAQERPHEELQRLSFADLPTTNFGDDAYAIVLDAAKRAIDWLIDAQSSPA